MAMTLIPIINAYKYIIYTGLIRVKSVCSNVLSMSKIMTGFGGNCMLSKLRIANLAIFISSIFHLSSTLILLLQFI